MDETAVRKYSTPKLGLVSLSPKLKRARKHGVHIHPANRQQQLAAFSHVAFLCDNTEIQAALPQVFIGNEHVLPAHVQQRVSPQLHGNVKLWRRKSSWVDGPMLMQILHLLSRALQPFSEKVQPVLFWDAAKAHLRPDVLRCAGKLGIWVIIIPARVTWLLQPADTHGFARYKAFLRKKYLEASSLAVDGRVNTDDIILAMNSAVRQVFQKQKWEGSFEGNGFGFKQRQVRTKILEHLQWETVPQVACSLPNLTQFATIWPQRLDVPIDVLFYAFLPRALPAPQQPSVVSATDVDTTPVPWIQRLRSRPDRIDDSQQSAASSARRRVSREPHLPASAVPCPPIPQPPARERRPRLPQPRAIPRCRR